MNYDLAFLILEGAVFVLLFCWMMMDRCNIYFRKED